ncbi:protein kinase domain-containing protein [Humibacter ginsenosidimutans]|nr:hypothetical protein [Humibacter ginsenosidimutans]
MVGRRGERTPAAGSVGTGDASDVWDELGGYRLLRALGRGSHATAYLATGDNGEVVVKVYDTTVEPARIRNEADALTAIVSPHVVELVDVSATARRPVSLVLERLTGPSLVHWLGERSVVEVGECVTVCASVVRAVRAVHVAGWVHGGVSSSSIRFDAAGCPVLLGFGASVPATPEGILADWAGCKGIIAATLAKAVDLDPREGERVGAALARLLDRSRPEEVADAAMHVEDALFALGPAAPVSLSSGSPGAPAVVPLRVEPQPAQTPLEPVREGAASKPNGLLGTATQLLEHGVADAARRRLTTLLSRHRRPAAIAVGAAALLTVVALVALPGPPDDGAAASKASPTTPDTSTTTAVTPAARHASDAPTATAGTSSSTPPAPDDPVRAAAALFLLRQGCLERHAVSCLVDSDQTDSPLYAADAALIAGKVAPAAAPQPSQLSLVESLGDTAVIAIAPIDAATTKPASALVIRTEAGWRLRAMFAN